MIKHAIIYFSLFSLFGSFLQGSNLSYQSHRANMSQAFDEVFKAVYTHDFGNWIFTDPQADQDNICEQDLPITTFGSSCSYSHIVENPLYVQEPVECDKCGGWTLSGPSPSYDDRIQIQDADVQAGEDCALAYTLENHTGAKNLPGGYTLELQTKTANASFDWEPWYWDTPDEIVYLYPALNLTITTAPNDPFSNASTTIEGSITSQSITEDVGLFLLWRVVSVFNLSLFGAPECFFQVEDLVFTMLQVAPLLEGAVELLLEPDPLGALEEFEKIQAEFIRRSEEVAISIGVDCLASIFSAALSQPGAVLKAFLALIAVFPDMVSDYVMYRDPIEITLSYDPNRDIFEIGRLVPSDNSEGDKFGSSVAIDGNVLVVSAFDDIRGDSSGSAYVYVQNTLDIFSWEQVAKLVPSDGDDYDHFGMSVAIEGDTIVVGASWASSAYIFELDQNGSWVQVKKLQPYNSARGGGFGFSVSISGDTLIIGALGGGGSAYIYDRNEGGDDNWGQTAVFFSPAGKESWFGHSVSIYGDVAMVGAPYLKGQDTGSVYLYARSPQSGGTWELLKEILARDGSKGDRFGASVSISSDILIVGALSDDDNGLESGSAYVFYKDHGGPNNWGEYTKLLASDGSKYDSFGNSVSLDHKRVVIGAVYENGQMGSAYVYERDHARDDEWVEIGKITASDGKVPDWYGHSVAISGDTIVAGASAHSGIGIMSGSAYIYSIGCKVFYSSE